MTEFVNQSPNINYEDENYYNTTNSLIGKINEHKDNKDGYGIFRFKQDDDMLANLTNRIELLIKDRERAKSELSEKNENLNENEEKLKKCEKVENSNNELNVLLQQKTNELNQAIDEIKQKEESGNMGVQELEQAKNELERIQNKLQECNKTCSIEKEKLQETNKSLLDEIENLEKQIQIKEEDQQKLQSIKDQYYKTTENEEGEKIKLESEKAESSKILKERLKKKQQERKFLDYIENNIAEVKNQILSNELTYINKLNNFYKKNNDITELPTEYNEPWSNNSINDSNNYLKPDLYFVFFRNIEKDKPDLINDEYNGLSDELKTKFNNIINKLDDKLKEEYNKRYNEIQNKLKQAEEVRVKEQAEKEARLKKEREEANKRKNFIIQKTIDITDKLTNKNLEELNEEKHRMTNEDKNKNFITKLAEDTMNNVILLYKPEYILGANSDYAEKDLYDDVKNKIDEYREVYVDKINFLIKKEEEEERKNKYNEYLPTIRENFERKKGNISKYIENKFKNEDIESFKIFLLDGDYNNFVNLENSLDNNVEKINFGGLMVEFNKAQQDEIERQEKAKKEKERQEKEKADKAKEEERVKAAAAVEEERVKAAALKADEEAARVEAARVEAEEKKLKDATMGMKEIEDSKKHLKYGGWSDLDGHNFTPGTGLQKINIVYTNNLKLVGIKLDEKFFNILTKGEKGDINIFGQPTYSFISSQTEPPISGTPFSHEGRERIFNIYKITEINKQKIIMKQYISRQDEKTIQQIDQDKEDYKESSDSLDERSINTFYVISILQYDFQKKGEKSLLSYLTENIQNKIKKKSLEQQKRKAFIERKKVPEKVTSTGGSSLSYLEKIVGENKSHDNIMGLRNLTRKNHRGGYRYSDLGMKGLTIVLTDAAPVKKVAKKKSKNKSKKAKGKKGKSGKKMYLGKNTVRRNKGSPKKRKGKK